jgi:hypothetical protein
MAVLKQSTAYTRMFYLVQSSDHISALTGASPTVNISKAGGSFAAAGGTVTEVANGWYKVALSTTDTNTLGDLAYHITAASGDPTDFVDQVTANILGDTLPANVTQFGGSNGTFSSGVPTVNVTSNVKKNTAISVFPFVMTDSSTHAPKTGVTVSAYISKDGGSLSACAGTVTEIGNGAYYINFTSGEMNCNGAVVRLTGAGCDDQLIPILTQP